MSGFIKMIATKVYTGETTNHAEAQMTFALPIPTPKLEQFCRDHHIQRLALFGSALRDDFRTDSDVDILVEFEPGRTPGFKFWEVEDELTKMFGRKVDLNTPQDLSIYFRQQVEAEAQPLYES